MDKPSDVDGFFRSNHIVKNVEQQKEIEKTCDKYKVIPQLFNPSRENSTFFSVWWAYFDLETQLQTVNLGWEGYCEKNGMRAGKLPNAARWASEQEIEDYMYEKLGGDVKRQVKIPAGIIDLLTEDSIYEVKYELTRSEVIKATGQLVIYSSMFPNHRKIIIGLPGKGEALRPYIEAVGIEVVTLDE